MHRPSAVAARPVCQSWFLLTRSGNFRLTPGVKAKFTEKLRLDPENFAGHRVMDVVRMDIRVAIPKFRVLPSPEERLRTLTDGADQAEAWAAQVQAKLQPLLERLFAYRTRIATLAVGLLAVWLFMHVTFGANGMVVYRAKRAEYQTLQKDIDRLQKENDQYTQNINELKTDPKMIEKEAREQFHYARPGEIIYVAPQRPANAPPSNRTARK